MLLLARYGMEFTSGVRARLGWSGLPLVGGKGTLAADQLVKMVGS